MREKFENDRTSVCLKVNSFLCSQNIPLNDIIVFRKKNLIGQMFAELTAAAYGADRLSGGRALGLQRRPRPRLGGQGSSRDRSFVLADHRSKSLVAGCWSSSLLKLAAGTVTVLVLHPL